MTDADIICGITIDLTPVYNNRLDRARCREHLVNGEEASSLFRTLLGRCAADSLTSILLSQLEREITCHVRSKVALISFDTESDLRDIFCVEMDVLGDLRLDKLINPVVGDLATSDLLCQSLKAAAETYSAQFISGPPVVWKVEFSEYRE